MANWQVISLDTTTPQLRAPGTGDGYSFNSGSTQLGVWTTTGLGIGTSSPAAKLDIVDGVFSVANTATSVDNTIKNLTATGTTGETTGISFDVANNANGVRIYAQRDGTYGSAGTRIASFRVATTTGGVESEKFVITGDGNVGIGTTSPSYSLSVENSLATQLYLRGAGAGFSQASILLASNTTSTPEIRALGTYMFNEGTDNTFYAGTLYNSANSWGIGVAAGATFQTSAADAANAKIVVTSTGNVGIGTVSPGSSSRLVVRGAGTTNATFSIEAATSGGATRFLVADDGLCRWYGTSNAETMRLDNAGNLGIGTSSPSSFAGYTTVSVNNATNGGIYNILVNGTETARLQAFSGAFVVAAKGASTNLLFETNGSERARITSAGVFQIANGGALNLTTTASGNGNISFDGSTFTIVSNSTTAAMVFSTNSTERARITSAGDVGIGTTNPITRLQVNAAAPTIRIEETTTGGFKRLEMGVTSGGLAFISAPQSAQDLTFNTTGTERARISSTGNVVVNTAAVATTATDGFLYIPTCAGAPTGVPTTFTGRSPLVVDSTNNRFYVYVNGAWKYATLT